MSTISFFISGIPTGQGRARTKIIPGKNGKPFAMHYTPAKTEKAQTCLLAQALQYRPETPITTPLRLDWVAVFPVPMSWNLRRRAAALQGAPHTGKPDRDNLDKLILDALTGPFFTDDKLVFGGTITKRYGAVAGVQITLTWAEDA